MFTEELLAIPVPEVVLCRKCGGIVPKHDNVSVFDCIRKGELRTEDFCHLLPVITDDGTVICEGSPSRTQYLDGQPRDHRAIRQGYRYDPSNEAVYRSIHAIMMAKFAPGSLETL